MVIFGLGLIGLCFGSFTNALVWRLHEFYKLNPQVRTKDYLQRLSILNGRSMCPNCKHELSALDLVPVGSWLALRGKCRYCHQPISWQYPIVELVVAALFIASYIYWPQPIKGAQAAFFGLWLIMLVGLVGLAVYDLRWQLLPNKIIYPLSVIAILMALITIVSTTNPARAILNELLAVVVGGGIFYILFQISAGKWIGGGDVKLGWLLGLVMGTPGRSVLLIFLATFIGSIISLPLLLTKRVKRQSTIPFGPLLILGAIIVQLFGHSILFWYQKTFFPFSV